MIEEFNEELALDAALVLKNVLEQRQHRKKYLGQVVIVPGKLGEALNLPNIIHCLSSRAVKSRQKGLEQFNELWATLSLKTKEKVLKQIGWYDPSELNWEDKRSNRRPIKHNQKDAQE